MKRALIASAGTLGFIVPFLLLLNWSLIGAFLIGGLVSAWCVIGTYWGVKAKTYMRARTKPTPMPVKAKVPVKMPPKVVLKPAPKLEPTEIEEAVFTYIQDRRGAIEKEECLADLSITEKQFNTAIRSLEKTGKLRRKKRD